MTVVTGSQALRMMWRSLTRLSVSPFARAVRTQSSLLTSMT